MIRILFSVLAVVAVVLAVVQDMPELYAAAVSLAVIVVVMWTARSWRRHQESRRPKRSRPPAKPQKGGDLQSLGILDIRQKNDFHPPAWVQAAPKPASEGERKQTAPPPVRTVEADQVRLKEFVTADAAPPPVRARTPPVVKPPDETVLVQFLEAVRAALDAHATCILRQNGDTFRCRVVAIAGEDRARVAGETFDMSDALLPYGAKAQPVTVLQVDGGDFPSQNLGYSRTPGSIQQIAVAPVNERSFFLVADTTRENGFSDPQASVILARFAETLGVLVGNYDPLESKPRPRREIIWEEMEAARMREAQLALAIVYLNDERAILKGGDAAVQEAELRLRTLLSNVSVKSRPVRFGVCMFGVFLYGDLPEIESWDQEVQQSVTAEWGSLSSGVSIGIAIMGPRHSTPDDLRDDAKDALGVAFTSGTSTVVG